MKVDFSPATLHDNGAVDGATNVARPDLHRSITPATPVLLVSSLTQAKFVPIEQ